MDNLQSYLLLLTKRSTVFCLLCLVIITTTSCSTTNDRDYNNKTEQHTNNQTVETEKNEATPQPTENTMIPNDNAASSSVDKLLASLTTEQKIGQLLLFGIDNQTVTKQTISMLQSYHLGGIILYKRNIDTVKQTNTLLNEMKDWQHTNNAIPLWLGVDQEGGKVSRLPKQLSALPEPGTLVNNDKPDYATNFGQAIGLQLQAVGFNLTFAPVLDINSNPNNPVIGMRAFGTTPDQVIDHGIAVMQGIQSQQIATSIKHFPGHGDTSVDSHLDLPLIEKSLVELENFELQPFAAALEHYVDMVMIGHLLIPAIDDTYPASMSTAAITGLLRDKMNYDGVVISDDMTMGGITDHWNIGEAAVQSLIAGTDIILVGHQPKLQRKVVQAINEAVTEGRISKERLDESVKRILLLKEKYKLDNEQTPMPNIESINKTVNELLQ
ncbi:beta-N-acetylhexosaminidase [Paenibacillus yanchengensis]|uniref:Beta-N-acetylhexosaminidase n=1 Tax=Paenibacillus yanchengensis TaxID=2035833 RepID=A0ABW4YNT6_9BACL